MCVCAGKVEKIRRVPIFAHTDPGSHTKSTFGTIFCTHGSHTKSTFAHPTMPPVTIVDAEYTTLPPCSICFCAQPVLQINGCQHRHKHPGPTEEGYVEGACVMDAQPFCLCLKCAREASTVSCAACRTRIFVGGVPWLHSSCPHKRSAFCTCVISEQKPTRLDVCECGEWPCTTCSGSQSTCECNKPVQHTCSGSPSRDAWLCGDCAKGSPSPRKRMSYMPTSSVDKRTRI